MTPMVRKRNLLFRKNIYLFCFYGKCFVSPLPVEEDGVDGRDPEVGGLQRGQVVVLFHCACVGSRGGEI